jgi:hypothetical protein
MSFYTRHRFGGNDRDPPLDAIAELLTELDEDPSDVEHDSVSVVHESDWAIAAYSGGLVTLEDVEDLDKEPRHMVVDDREKVLQLFRAVADGRLAEVFDEPWQPGYGNAAGA